MNKKIVIILIIILMGNILFSINQYKQNNVYKRIINVEIHNQLYPMIKDFIEIEKLAEKALEKKILTKDIINSVRIASVELNKIEEFISKIKDIPVANDTKEVLYIIRLYLESLETIEFRQNNNQLNLNEENSIVLNRIRSIFKEYNYTIDKYKAELRYEIRDINFINNDTWIELIKALNETTVKSDNYDFFIKLSEQMRK